MTATWLASLAIDARFGEPPRSIHPVVLAGRIIGAIERRIPRTRAAARSGGVVVLLAPAALAVLLSLAMPAPFGIWWLKTTFSLRELVDAADRVKDALAHGTIEKARAAVGEIVSRPTVDLDERHIASAAIESVAENLCDSYVAPLFWYAVAGPPGAAIYRAVNTADAMVGYRDDRHRDVGLIAARADDVLSFLPARISALALAAAAPVVGGAPAVAMRTALREARSTASPNSGWPMAAAAGALGVRLEKRGHHVLGDGRDPEARDIARARRLVLAAACILTAAFVGSRRW